MCVIRETLANVIFAFHCAVVAVIGFGWMIPIIWPLYMVVLLVTLISEVTFGYCFLSRWEFDLRKRIDPTLDYGYSFSSFYTYKLTHRRLSQRFIKYAGLAFLVGSVAINAYFKFVS
jgi:hypothetical protein